MITHRKSRQLRARGRLAGQYWAMNRCLHHSHATLSMVAVGYTFAINEERTHIEFSLRRGATGKHYQARNLLCISVIDV